MPIILQVKRFVIDDIWVLLYIDRLFNKVCVKGIATKMIYKTW